MEQEKTLDISWGAITKIFIAIFIFYIIYIARDIALWFLFGLAISILLDPAILFLKRFWLPKFIAILIVYSSIFGVLGALIYLTAPIFIFELKQFSQFLPEYFFQINPFLQKLGINVSQSFNDVTGLLLGGLQSSSKGILSAIIAFFGGLSSTVIILTIAFFFSLEDNGPKKMMILLAPKKFEERIEDFFDMAQIKVAGWFGARIVACLFVGSVSFIVFYLFDVKYAFLLALIAGILNFIPYIGPWITAFVLAILIAVSSGSWFLVLYMLIAFFIIQALENIILTPLLMKKLINLPPVLVLVSLLLGAKIFGFLGTIFAVPVFGIIYEFTKEILEKRREETPK